MGLAASPEAEPQTRAKALEGGGTEVGVAPLRWAELPTPSGSASIIHRAATPVPVSWLTMSAPHDQARSLSGGGML